jgi:hypothetical protein
MHIAKETNYNALRGPLNSTNVWSAGLPPALPESTTKGLQECSPQITRTGELYFHPSIFTDQFLTLLMSRTIFRVGSLSAESEPWCQQTGQYGPCENAAISPIPPQHPTRNGGGLCVPVWPGMLLGPRHGGSDSHLGMSRIVRTCCPAGSAGACGVHQRARVPIQPCAALLCVTSICNRQLRMSIHWCFMMPLSRGTCDRQPIRHGRLAASTDRLGNRSTCLK